MLVKICSLIFLLQFSLLAHANLRQELQMLKKSSSNITVNSWDTAQTTDSSASNQNSDEISITSSAIKKPTLPELEESDQSLDGPKQSQFKTTRKRSR